jgi:hypothetical protein
MSSSATTYEPLYVVDTHALMMHDRMIVGLARRLNAPLLTADAQMTAARLAPVVW